MLHKNLLFNTMLWSVATLLSTLFDTSFIPFTFSLNLKSGIIMDKIMGLKLKYISIDVTQKYLFCRLNYWLKSLRQRIRLTTLGSSVIYSNLKCCITGRKYFCKSFVKWFFRSWIEQTQKSQMWEWTNEEVGT